MREDQPTEQVTDILLRLQHGNVVGRLEAEIARLRAERDEERAEIVTLLDHNEHLAAERDEIKKDREYWWSAFHTANADRAALAACRAENERLDNILRGKLLREYEADITAPLVAETESLRADLGAARDRERRLRTLEDWVVAHGRHRRGCQRARCARPFCDSCVCSCGFDDVKRAALAGDGGVGEAESRG